ncbi:MAG: cobalt-precorrin-5B (C(1))-methyltransferase, partial [Candidatus Brocadia sp.]
TLAEKTFNPKLGIVGGISIIGTTGIVRPMSEDAFKTSLLCGLDIARGIGYETVVLVPGSLGEHAMLNLVNIPRDQIIQISNFVGFMLNAARERRFQKIILAGHPGKLVKLLRGDFHTHSAVSKPANDILIDIITQHCCNQLATPLSPPSQGGDFVVSAQSNEEGEVKTCKKFLHGNTSIEGAPLSNTILNRLKEVSTVEGIVELLRDYRYLSVMDEIAERIVDKVRAFFKGEQLPPTEVGVILFDMKGSIVGISNSAQSWLNLIKIKSSS